MPSEYVKRRWAEIQANPDLVAKVNVRADKSIGREPKPGGPKPDPDFLSGQDKTKGWVYFIRDEGGSHLKIGFAKDRERRLASLRSGNVNRLEIIASFATYRASEKILHDHFKKHRARGEWFDYVEDFEELFDDIMDFQGMVTAGAANNDGDGSGVDFVADMDVAFMELSDLRTILATLYKPWSQEFRDSLKGRPRMQGYRPHVPREFTDEEKAEFRL
jgi:hypothetical protein